MFIVVVVVVVDFVIDSVRQLDIPWYVLADLGLSFL
jgi:hypothetical protein